MSHTRGPWMAASHPANGRLPIVSQANGRSVGSVSWFGTLPEGFKGNEQECHANAQLIAAAPDLLEALREAERYMTYFSGEDLTFVGPGMPADCLKMIRSAIVKAVPA